MTKRKNFEKDRNTGVNVLENVIRYLTENWLFGNVEIIAAPDNCQAMVRAWLEYVQERVEMQGMKSVAIGNDVKQNKTGWKNAREKKNLRWMTFVWDVKFLPFEIDQSCKTYLHPYSLSNSLNLIV